MALEQIVEAVIGLRDHDRDAPAAIAVQPVIHVECVAHAAYVGFEGAAIGDQRRQIEAQALEEQLGLGIGVLVGVLHAHAVALEQLRQRRDDAGLVLAADEQRRELRRLR